MGIEVPPMHPLLRALSGTAAGVLAATVLLVVPVQSAARPALAAADAEARAVVAALPRATAANDADGNKLFDDLDEAFSTVGEPERVDVIVVFVQGTSTVEGIERVRTVAPEAVVRRSFSIIPAFSGALTVTEALLVGQLVEVRQIELDDVIEPTMDTAAEIFGVRGIVEGLGITGSLDGDDDTATTADIGIAVLDSGIDLGHIDLEGKLIDWHDAAFGGVEPVDRTGHGTHVASIAAGWGRGDPAYRGVAPGASIMAVNLAVEDNGNTTEAVIVAGLEYVLERAPAHHVRIATMSYGGGEGATDGTSADALAIDALWDSGVAVFVSAGNSGSGIGTITRQGAARGVVTVGSVLDPFGWDGGQADVASRELAPLGGFMLNDWSGRGPTEDGRIKPDLLGPGMSITAAQAGTREGYVAFSGTSMSTPFVAGSAALMLAADPTLTPDEIREVMLTTAEDFGAPGPDPEYGYGRLQVHQALQQLDVPIGNIPAPVVPMHSTAITKLDDMGTATVAFDVADFDHPLVVTAIYTGKVFTHSGDTVDGVDVLMILDPAGVPVGDPRTLSNHTDTSRAVLLGRRQHARMVEDGVPGTYTVIVTGSGPEEFVVDASHSTVPR